ncbi:MAG: PAS-domain containing protein, partial [Shimia sp.]
MDARLLSQNSVAIWERATDGSITEANAHGRELVALIERTKSCGTLYEDPPFAEQRRIDVADTPYRVTADRTVGAVLFTAFPAAQELDERIVERQSLQTLTRTFAHLSVGLAIFDPSRRLIQFNPALTALFELPAHEIIRHPSLSRFLDILRTSGALAEPQDYKAWRARIQAFGLRPEQGAYEECWALPGGRTVRVSGRPHPDGAIAFSFEDISRQTHFSRNARSEIDRAHLALDTVKDAVIIFEANGCVAYANKAYQDLWNTPPASGLVP